MSCRSRGGTLADDGRHALGQEAARASAGRWRRISARCSSGRRCRRPGRAALCRRPTGCAATRAAHTAATRGHGRDPRQRPRQPMPRRQPRPRRACRVDRLHARQVGQAARSKPGRPARGACRATARGHRDAGRDGEDGERQGRVGHGRGKDERPGNGREQAGADGTALRAPVGTPMRRAASRATNHASGARSAPGGRKPTCARIEGGAQEGIGTAATSAARGCHSSNAGRGSTSGGVA